MSIHRTPSPRIGRTFRDGPRALTLGFGLVTVSGCSALFGIELLPLESSNGAVEAGGDAGAESASGRGGSGAGGSDRGGNDVEGSGGDQAGAAFDGTGGGGGDGAGAAGDGGGDGSDGGRSGTTGGLSAGSSGRQFAAGDAGTGGDGGAGSGGGGAGAGSGGDSANAGNAGTAGTGERPFVLAGESCDEPGMLACDAARNGNLFCAGGEWRTGWACEGDECDRRTGACTEVHSECSGANPGDSLCSPYEQLFICGPDRVTAVRDICVFGCTEINDHEAYCDLPHNGQIRVERPPEGVGEGLYWPNAPIPICVNDPTREEWRWVREEIGETWSRFSSVGFTGWGTCDQASTGVKVTLTGPNGARCVDELGGIDHVGFPGTGRSVEVWLCLHYADLEGNEHETSPELLRLVARHQFGHVLGFDDVFKFIWENEFMTPGFDTLNLGAYQFGREHINRLHNTYDRKQPGAFGDRFGDCLSARTGTLAFEACDATSSEQFFRVAEGQIQHADGTCLHAAEDGSIGLSACLNDDAGPHPAQAWRPTTSQFRGYAGLCLGWNAEEDQVWAEICEPFGSDLHQLWNVESVDDGERIRVRQGAESCLLASGDGFTLGPCGQCPTDDPDCEHFRASRAGHVVPTTHCLTVPNMILSAPRVASVGYVFAEGCTLGPHHAWNLSARFENGNMALTRVERGGVVTLEAQVIGQAASADQVFDTYFTEDGP